MAKIYPSLLSADFLKLQEELTQIEASGAAGVNRITYFRSST